MLRVDSASTELVTEIDACLVQLDTICDSRNKLIHRTVRYREGKLIASNSFTAKTKEGIQNDVFSKTELNAMANDCRLIFLRLLAAAGSPVTGNAETDAEIDLELMQQPWLYKPAQPSPQKRSHQKARKARQRQRGPSPT
jgi:hypothetical protein